MRNNAADLQRVFKSSTKRQGDTHESGHIMFLGQVGSKTGAALRNEIDKDRMQLINEGRDELPRDSELSGGKYDEDLDKVKHARVRVQNRLLHGNAVNSSDEDDGAKNEFAGGSKSSKTVMHFKRKTKSGAAAQIKRQRAGRFGRKLGEAGGLSDETDSSYASGEDSEDSFDGEDGPREDEYYCIDAQGYRVNGRYDTEGYFIVDVSDRDVPGRCDAAGYLLDGQGYRV